MKGTCLVLLCVWIVCCFGVNLRTANKKSSLMAQVFGKKSFSEKPDELRSDFQTFLDLVRGKQDSSIKFLSSPHIPEIFEKREQFELGRSFYFVKNNHLFFESRHQG